MHYGIQPSFKKGHELILRQTSVANQGAQRAGFDVLAAVYWHAQQKAMSLPLHDMVTAGNANYLEARLPKSTYHF